MIIGDYDFELHRVIIDQEGNERTREKQRAVTKTIHRWIHSADLWMIIVLDADNELY
jgi:hypothetical protein